MQNALLTTEADQSFEPDRSRWQGCAVYMWALGGPEVIEYVERGRSAGLRLARSVSR